MSRAPSSAPEPPALTPEEVAALHPLPRHERARRLLAGEVGPLATHRLGCGEEERALSYLCYLAWIRARVPGGLLSGRPSYEAAETMRARVFTAARRSGSFREFGSSLFERLKQHTSSLRQDDALWWRAAAARLDEGGRWSAWATDLALSEVCTSMRLLDDWLRIVVDAERAEDRWATDEGTPLVGMTDQDVMDRVTARVRARTGDGDGQEIEGVDGSGDSDGRDSAADAGPERPEAE